MATSSPLREVALDLPDRWAEPLANNHRRHRRRLGFLKVRLQSKPWTNHSWLLRRKREIPAVLAGGSTLGICLGRAKAGGEEVALVLAFENSITQLPEQFSCSCYEWKRFVCFGLFDVMLCLSPQYPFLLPHREASGNKRMSNSVI